VILFLWTEPGVDKKSGVALALPTALQKTARFASIGALYCGGFSAGTAATSIW
jgi:hypothetical protein